MSFLRCLAAAQSSANAALQRRIRTVVSAPTDGSACEEEACPRKEACFIVGGGHLHGAMPDACGLQCLQLEIAPDGRFLQAARPCISAGDFRHATRDGKLLARSRRDDGILSDAIALWQMLNVHKDTTLRADSSPRRRL